MEGFSQAVRAHGRKLFCGDFLLVSLPWILHNNTQPILGMPPWPTRIANIFRVDQSVLLLANNPGLTDDYSLTAKAIADAGCRDVGLVVDQTFLEYPLWWLLDAPQSGIHLKVLVGESDRLYSEDLSENICTVVRTHCSDQAPSENLPWVSRFDSLSVYLSG